MRFIETKYLINKKELTFQFLFIIVLGAGLEPAQALLPTGF